MTLVDISSNYLLLPFTNFMCRNTLNPDHMVSMKKYIKVKYNIQS